MLRILTHLLGVCLGLSLAASATTIAAPQVHPRLVELERLRQERGWTFEMKYTEVLERPLPRRIPLRTMSSRQSPEPSKEPRSPPASANKGPGGPWNTRCDSSADQWDWRTEGHVGDIRDQGRQCLSCWAFAAVAAFEASYSVQHGRYASASEQDVLNCASDSSDCTGGQVADAYKVLMKRGAMSATVEPYAAQRSECATRSGQMRAQAWGYVDDDAVIASTPAIKKALCAHGPSSRR